MLGDKESLVHKRIPVPGGIGHKDPDLAFVYLADGAAILAPHSYGIIAFFNKAGFIKDYSTLRVANIVIYQTTIFEPDGCVVPRGITDKTLHGPDITALDSQS
jgi:hypothetical protein